MELDLPICATCGVQYPAPREDCPICLDERQYVGGTGSAGPALPNSPPLGTRATSGRWRRVVRTDGTAAVARSAERYLRFALGEHAPAPPGGLG